MEATQKRACFNMLPLNSERYTKYRYNSQFPSRNTYVWEIFAPKQKDIPILLIITFKISYRLMKLVPFQTIPIQTIALCLELGGYKGGRVLGDTSAPIVNPLRVAEENFNISAARSFDCGPCIRIDKIGRQSNFNLRSILLLNAALSPTWCI